MHKYINTDVQTLVTLYSRSLSLKIIIAQHYFHSKLNLLANISNNYILVTKLGFLLVKTLHVPRQKKTNIAKL